MEIAKPASVQDVLAVEQQLGLTLPESLRHVLTEFSSAVWFRWIRPDGLQFEPPFHEIFSGECGWNLARLVDMKIGYQQWLNCFANPDDPYDRVWHNKLVFWDVPNGDALALDLTQPSAPVVYLSHDDGQGHGYVLGENFADFIDRWTKLGCVGSEDWQMLPFLPMRNGGLDTTGENAVRWRQVFGLAED